MLDPRRLRSDLDVLKKGLARRGVDTSALDQAAELDERQRAAAAQRDELRAQVNAISKEVGEAYRNKDTAGAEAKKEQSRALGEQEAAREAEAKDAGDRLRDILLRTPNIPADEAPDGDSPEDNVVLRIEGHDPGAYQDHQRVPHWDVGAELDNTPARSLGRHFAREHGEAVIRVVRQLVPGRRRQAEALVQALEVGGRRHKRGLEAAHVVHRQALRYPRRQAAAFGGDD